MSRNDSGCASPPSLRFGEVGLTGLLAQANPRKTIKKPRFPGAL